MKDLHKDPGASLLAGYAEPARVVNAVHRTNVAHHPDPYDPTPVKQGITVYYGDMNYGRISFAMLEVKRGSGTRVRRRASWALLDDDVLAWHLSVDPKPAFLRQLLDMRRMMEPKAAGWAAMHGMFRNIEQPKRTMLDVDAQLDAQTDDARYSRSVLG